MWLIKLMRIEVAVGGRWTKAFVPKGQPQISPGQSVAATPHSAALGIDPNIPDALKGQNNTFPPVLFCPFRPSGHGNIELHFAELQLGTSPSHEKLMASYGPQVRQPLGLVAEFRWLPIGGQKCLLSEIIRLGFNADEVTQVSPNVGLMRPHQIGEFRSWFSCSRFHTPMVPKRNPRGQRIGRKL